MNRLNRLLTQVAAMVLCSAMISCTAVPAGNAQVRQARGQFDTRRTYAQGIIGGAVAGALIGAAIGAATGGRDSIARGAMIGGLGGATAGGLYARNVVAQRQAYMAREGALDGAIANAKSTKTAAQNFNQVLASQLYKAKSDTQSTKGTVADANAVLASVNREIARQRQLIATSGPAVSSRDRSRLEQEIYGLEMARRQLEANIRRLTPASPGTGGVATSP